MSTLFLPAAEDEAGGSQRRLARGHEVILGQRDRTSQ
jgi:hypothetical protein